MAYVDADALAEIVVNIMQRALAPVSADLQVLKSQLAERESGFSEVGMLRERIAVMESKDFVTRSAIRDVLTANAIDAGELLSLVLRGLDIAA